MNKILIWYWLCCFALWAGLAQGQDSNLGKLMPDFELKPVIAFQLWSTYTMGQEVFNVDIGQYRAVANRLNFQLRRSRLGVKGRFSQDLFFNITTAVDLVGRDLLAGTEAGGNNGASPKPRLWNAYLRWRIIPGKEQFNVVAGYFVPQIGRESMTSALRVNSMEKAWSQNYLRRHLAGTGPGRTLGMQLGGLVISEEGTLHWRYDIGIFNPAFRAYQGNSVGDRYAPLITGRLAAYFGDPESGKYTLGRRVNYFGKRQGLTLALAAAIQGDTDVYQGNGAAGLDFLWNHKNLQVDGEWMYLWRVGRQNFAGAADPGNVALQTGHLRIGYNISLAEDRFLEPVVMLVQFRGATDYQGQIMADSLHSPSGSERTIDLGGNYYFNANLKLSLHYTFRRGDEGEAGPGSGVNNLFYQSGVGAIHRGDWLGLGMVTVF